MAIGTQQNPWGIYGAPVNWGANSQYQTAYTDVHENGPLAKQMFAQQNPGASDNFVKDGVTYQRIGDPSQFTNLPQNQITYDENAGYIIPRDAYYSAIGYDPNSQDFLGKVGVPALMAAMGGAGLWAGGTGAGAGAAGGIGDVSSYYGASNPSMIEGLSGGVGGSTGGVGGAVGGSGLASGATGAFDMGGLTGTGLEGDMAGGTGLLGSLNSALGTNLTGSDVARIGTGLGQGLLGYLGSQAQSNAYEDVANQQAAIGAPYRNTLEASYQPGFDLMSQPGYGDAFNRIADISSRSYSAKMGNPADNPTAQAGILNDVWQQGYLPALSNYRGQLGQFGGLGLNTSGAASLAGAQSSGGTYDALGYGLGTALGGNSLTDQYLQGLLKQQQQQQRLSIGGNIL